MLGKDDLQVRWWKLEEKLMERFGKKPDVETILFMIGIQELGDIREKFTKEQKQDLMHIAVCTVLAPSGYYELSHVDEEGWPHFKQLMGKAVYTNRCGRCHALKNTKAFTSKDWEIILPVMIPRARLNESEAQQVRAYVMAHTKK